MKKEKVIVRDLIVGDVFYRIVDGDPLTRHVVIGISDGMAICKEDGSSYFEKFHLGISDRGRIYEADSVYTLYYSIENEKRKVDYQKRIISDKIRSTFDRTVLNNGKNFKLEALKEILKLIES